MPTTPPRRITLTFDNGPHPDITPRVLDILARHQLRTTFFVLGSQAATPAGAALLRRAVAEGHQIGNHTHTHHKPLGLLPPDQALAEFLNAHHAIADALGHPPEPLLFRPYGDGGRLGPHLLQPAVTNELIARHYTCVLWNSLPGDWYDPSGWLPRGLADVQSRPWSLTVLHDHKPNLLPHLEAFLTELKSHHFTFTPNFPEDCTPILNGQVLHELPTA